MHLSPSPLSEQRTIVQYLEKVHGKIKEINEEIKKSEEELKLLEKSVLDKAFKGKL